MPLNIKRFAPLVLVIALDIVPTALLICSRPFVDAEDVRYILFSPIYAYMIIVMLWLLLLMVKRVRRMRLEFHVLAGNMLWVYLLFYPMLGIACRLGVVGVYQVRTFNAGASYYVLAMAESDHKLRHGNSFFIMDGYCFSCIHGSFVMVHKGPRVVAGWYETVNDTLVLLHCRNRELRIVRHIDTSPYVYPFVYYLGGKRVTDTLANNYLCGFQDNHDSLWLGNGSANLDIFRPAMK